MWTWRAQPGGGGVDISMCMCLYHTHTDGLSTEDEDDDMLIPCWLLQVVELGLIIVFCGLSSISQSSTLQNIVFGVISLYNL